MKKTVAEHAERFSEKAAEYDDSKSEEYHACASLVIDHASPEPDDVVLDLGAGTGAIALAVAEDAERVLARDISEGMMDEGRRKAEERGLDNVEFAYGEFRDPEVDPDQGVDVVTSNFALHHLADDEKREAIRVMAETGARRIVLGDVAFFEAPDPDEPFYSPEVDDPATVGTLVEAFTAEGFAVTAVERVHDQVAVIVAERIRELPA
ncbi:class I SAM-dependent methyltransferase [Halorubrum sp. Atlit-8R]|uniref:class I SAM-dependent methyltransferase n=1 Tax=unclassified Halorubrum TaxID=2642239 RepID=UPI000EF2561A|nr:MULTISPECIES: class I SAM-dependent methyltransferase [unclassified Halorubrum]RLM63600.1 class I SAM-dependent methyltransferase [Halorubrum sp. Atlit-9R]RLM77075.1 class I SAM-dependent methyltransferase [Halorubrum sp. Atlit-8R]